MGPCRRLAVAGSLLWLAAAVPARGEGRVGFDLFGDFRLRLEQDWDSLQGDGTERDDRLRLRIRVRGGFQVEFGERWSLLVQARTGPDLSQQSPHITIHDFDGGPDGPYDVNLDHWYVGYKSGRLEAWVGRNELTLWKQDDLFVFDNVTFAGAGFVYRQTWDKASLSWSLNYFTLPIGMRDFSGTGVLGQVAYAREFENRGITVAGSLQSLQPDPDDPAGEILLTENNTRDYLVFDLQFQYRSRALGRPVEGGFDFSYNLESYDDAQPGSFSEFHRNDVAGYVLEIAWGGRDRPGDWLVGYFYAHLDALTVNSSYIQDDWVRWGNASQVRATNLKGSELRAIYTLRDDMNLFARLFLVDAVDLLEPGDTTKETGNRFRIDWNFSF